MSPISRAQRGLVLVLAMSALNCNEPPAQPAAASVELVRAVSLGSPTIVIGQDAGPDDDFLFPLIAGQDGSGSVYVYEARLNELRRFAPSGGFERVVARRGTGPGEVAAPSTFVIDSATVGVWEGRTGRYTRLSRDGRVLEEADLGLRAGRRQSTSLLYVLGNRNFIVAARSEQPVACSARPIVNVTLLRVRAPGARSDTLYTYTTPSTLLRFHGGGTSVPDPGPTTGPLAVFDRFTTTLIRVERPVPASAGRATFSVQRIDDDGHVEKRRDFSVAATPFPRATRDSIERELLGIVERIGSTQPGADPLWPDYYPAVEIATMSKGRDGRLWLKLAPGSAPNAATWLVLDRE